MAEIQDLLVTDASNTARWPENMAFSAVNDAGRSDEGILARWYKDMDGSVTSSGAANAFAATSNRTIAAYFNNLTFTFTANFTITGAATLNLNGLGAKNIKRFNGDPLVSGDITSGQPVTVIYKSSPDIWYMMTAAAALSTAAATIAITSYADFTENAAPGTPAADVARLHAKDDGSGTTVVAYVDSAAVVRTLLSLASQAVMETGTSTVSGPSVATQKHHPAHPKAWGYVASDGTLNASAGITSSVRNSTGHYTVTLSAAMSSTTYAVLGSLNASGVPFGFSAVVSSTTVFTVETTASGSFSDRAFSFAVFGDLP